MEIHKAFTTQRALLDLHETELPAIVHATLDYAVAQGQLPVECRVPVETALLADDADACTPIGDAVAVPHVHLAAVNDPMVLFVRLAHPLNLGAPDGIPTQFFFFLIGSVAQAAGHLETLMKIARLMSDDQFRAEAREASSAAVLLDAYDDFLARTAPAPERPPPALPEGLVRTGRLAGGLAEDIRRRWRTYRSDFTDGAHPKVLASVLFLFFACLAPAVAFGGLMSVMTAGQIGTVEMILASALCGVAYALLSGQPITILGGTGPMLIFTGLLYGVCEQLGIPFLATYAWVGLWTAFFTIILAVTDASFLIRYFTRFTDEIFASLIALIFIYEAVKDLVGLLLSDKVSHDAAFFSVLLAVGTLYVANALKNLKHGRYLRHWLREFLADFGPAIAIAAMTAAAVAYSEVDLPKLAVPDTFQTTSGRSWLVDPVAAPVWVWFAAAGPALLATLLVYMDQNITTRIINSPANRLRKGTGYHLDLSVVGALIAVCSIFGLPWLVAATVRSLNHLRSLATVEEVRGPGGVARERIISVRENRLSALLIHGLLGLSLVFLPLLQQVPMAVLFGLFLYMGFTAMQGIQFFERLKLWLMDPALYPVTHYIRRVPIREIHKYTLLQALCLALLWVVKASVLGILFPLFIAVLVPTRLLARRFFQVKHLEVLDAEEEPQEEEERYG